MAQPKYVNFLNQEGVDLNVIYTMTASLTPETPAPPFAVGTEVIGSGGAQFMFVQASTSITAGDFVAITNTGQANSLTATNAVAAGGVRIGVAPIPVIGASLGILAGQYFWAALNGNNITGNTISTATSNVQLYATATAGQVSSVTTNTVGLGGIVVALTLTTTTVAAPAPATFTLSWPRAVVIYSSTTGTVGGANNP